MPERVKLTVRASGAHPDVLTVQDAMRQVLDLFDMLASGVEGVPGVEWKLVSASTNSPFHLAGEAVSLEPSVDVSVVARNQKQSLAKSLREVVRGEVPTNPDFQVKTAKRFFDRNLNGVGFTEIDFDLGEPIVVTPTIALEAYRVLDAKKPTGLFDFRSPRDEIGSVEGTLQEVKTHWNHPAVKIADNRNKEQVWCRLNAELQAVFQDKATYSDFWHHRRVIVRGRIKYADDGSISYVLAHDIQRIDARDVSLDSIKDPDFTGGLSVGEYLDRFRDGALG